MGTFRMQIQKVYYSEWSRKLSCTFADSLGALWTCLRRCAVHEHRSCMWFIWHGSARFDALVHGLNIYMGRMLNNFKIKTHLAKHLE